MKIITSIALLLLLSTVTYAQEKPIKCVGKSAASAPCFGEFDGTNLSLRGARGSGIWNCKKAAGSNYNCSYNDMQGTYNSQNSSFERK
jgi:hypothetical protein